jgi:hypothetical protein
VGPRNGLDGCGKSHLYRNSIPEASSPQQVAIPITVHQPPMLILILLQCTGLLRFEPFYIQSTILEYVHNSIGNIFGSHSINVASLRPFAYYACGFISRRDMMSVSCERCILSGGGLCDGPITSPEGSYRVWCV